MQSSCSFSLTLLAADGEWGLYRPGAQSDVAVGGPLPPLASGAALLEYVASTAAQQLLQLGISLQAPLPCKFATVLPVKSESPADRVAGKPLVGPMTRVLSPSAAATTTDEDSSNSTALEWVFYAAVPAEMLAAWTPQLRRLTDQELAVLAYTEQVSPRLARLAQSFAPLSSMLRRSTKSTIPAPPPAMSAQELADYRLLEPCYYVFDIPGKGVRSDAIKALAAAFQIHPADLKSLVEEIDRYHNISLIIDDIQDGSTLRRDQPCAHLKFGTPWTMNSAYLLTFELIEAVPRLFRRYHQETTQRILRGCVAAHRGQGLEIYWRDNGICPTEDEYVEMVRGKTSTPFVLGAELFFLHSDDVRLTASRWLSGTLSTVADTLSQLLGYDYAQALRFESIQSKIVRLFDLTGIFFQIRDDYINLVDPEYWKKKGFVDDIHERKFSFPIIYMVRRRLGRYQELLRLYKRPEELQMEDLKEALTIVRETDALQYTYDYLMNMEQQLRCLAEAVFPPFGAVLSKLKVMPPDTPAGA